MVSEGRHPKKDINAALDALDSNRFAVVEDHKGHRWGRVVCCVCGESFTVHGTPRNPWDEGERIRRFTGQHSHTDEA